MKLYTLDKDKNVIPANGSYMPYDARRVAFTENKTKKICVSTVFLEMDHGWCTDKPLVFETLVHGGKYSEDQERYSTWNEALRGHYIICKKVFRWSNKKFEKILAKHFVEFL